jgi:hypothetical protein
MRTTKTTRSATRATAAARRADVNRGAAVAVGRSPSLYGYAGDRMPGRIVTHGHGLASVLAALDCYAVTGY